MVAFNTGDITLLFLISIIHNEVVACRVKDFLVIEEMNMISPIARDTKDVPNELAGKEQAKVLGSDCGSGNEIRRDQIGHGAEFDKTAESLKF